MNTWDSNPIIASWKREVEAAGGRALATGYPFPPDKGSPTAVYLVDESLGWEAGGNRRYELAPSYVRAAVGWERTQDSVTLASGKVAEGADSIVKATGLDKGLSGVIGRALGVPPGFIIGGAVLAGIVIGYAALVNVGILPPLNRGK